MNRRQLLSHLRENGCHLDREGARHSVYVNAATKVNAAVPRHGEIDNRLASKICKELGIADILRP